MEGDEMIRFRQIHTKIWKDAWFETLTIPQKLFYIYLFSNERASLSGIYELPLRHMIFETGLSEDQITEAFQVFEAAEKAWYDDGVVLMPNLRKYHATKSWSVQKSINTDLELLRDCKLKRLYLKMFDVTEPEQDTPISPDVDDDYDGPTILTPKQSRAMTELENLVKLWAKLPKLGDSLFDDERVLLRDLLIQAVNKGRRGTAVYTYDGGTKETKLKQVVAYCNVRQVPTRVIKRCFIDEDGFWYTASYGKNKGEAPHPQNIINELEKAVTWYNERTVITR